MSQHKPCAHFYERGPETEGVEEEVITAMCVSGETYNSHPSKQKR